SPQDFTNFPSVVKTRKYGATRVMTTTCPLPSAAIAEVSPPHVVPAGSCAHPVILTSNRSNKLDCANAPVTVAAATSIAITKFFIAPLFCLFRSLAGSIHTFWNPLGLEQTGPVKDHHNRRGNRFTLKTGDWSRDDKPLPVWRGGKGVIVGWVSQVDITGI